MLIASYNDYTNKEQRVYAGWSLTQHSDGILMLFLPAELVALPATDVGIAHFCVRTGTPGLDFDLFTKQ